MPTILLIRHGQALFGSENYDELSPLGVEQAALVADTLVARRLDVRRVVSGDLRRQRDTAAPAAAAYGLEIEIDPRWNEYEMDTLVAAYANADHVDDVTSPRLSLSSADYQDVLERALSTWISVGAGTTERESWPGFSNRVSLALDALAGDLAPGGVGLVFTSGGVVAAVCAAVLELPLAGFLHFNRVTVNAAITKLSVGRRGITLLSFNDHGHLEHSAGASSDARSLISYR